MRVSDLRVGILASGGSHNGIGMDDYNDYDNAENGNFLVFSSELEGRIEEG